MAATSKRSSEASFMERTGWCGQEILVHTTPSARANVASQLSLDRASTPPPAEEGSRLLQLSKRSGNLGSNSPNRRGARQRGVCRGVWSSYLHHRFGSALNSPSRLLFALPEACSDLPSSSARRITRPLAGEREIEQTRTLVETC